jgi:hypothetical protein
LNEIFGPDHWQHTIQEGPKLVDVNERNAYVQVTVRLTVMFANGQVSIHDDVGVWPLAASKDKTLEDAAPERYETVLKAAVTDGLKACTEYLGVCFRPLADKTLDQRVRRGAAMKVGTAPGQPVPASAFRDDKPPRPVTIPDPAPAAAAQPSPVAGAPGATPWQKFVGEAKGATGAAGMASGGQQPPAAASSEQQLPAAANGERQPPAGGNGQGRPYAPEVLRTKFQDRVAIHGKRSATQGQVNLVAMTLETCFAEGGSKALRHAVVQYLTEVV